MNRGSTRPPFPFHRNGSAYEPQEIPMSNLALTMLPIVVTFGVAAWYSPSDAVQPRSALRGGKATSRPTPCDC